MATAKQIAARKRFAEMARSGELAKMRKKSTKRNPAKTVSQEISQQMRKGKGQKQAVAIALEMERAGKLMKNPIQTFSVQLSDKKPIKTVTADSFDDALEMAVGRRFFSASSDSYRRSGDVTTDKFFNVMVKDPNGTTTYRDGKRLIRLKQIRAQVSLFEIPKRNPTATRAPARSRTKLVSSGREKNPISKIYHTLEYTEFPYKVQSSKTGRNFKDVVGTPSKETAIFYAKSYAKEYPDEYVRVFKIDVSEDYSDEVKKKS